MLVSEMLEMMALLSVGSDALTPSTQNIFLKYLNLANQILYTDTANINPDLLVDESITTEVNVDSVELSTTPFSVPKLYTNGSDRPLQHKFFLDFLDLKRNMRLSGRPQFFTFRKNELSFYPIESGKQYTLDVWYVPPVETLRADTGEESIPLPVSFHHVLVDTALYYLFLDEEGFKETKKAQEAKERAQKGKGRLIAYLYSNTCQTISTFSNA